MTRSRYSNNAFSTDAGIVYVVPNSEVTVYEPGTTSPVAQTVYTNVSGGTVKGNPHTTDAYGNIVFYLDTAQRVKIVATGLLNGNAVSVTADYEPVLPDPADLHIDGQTTPASLAGGLTVWKSSGDSFVARNAANSADIASIDDNGLIVTRLAVGDTAAPVGNSMLISRNAADQFYQAASFEYANTYLNVGAGASDVSVLRLVGHNQQDQQFRPLEAHLLRYGGATVAQPSHGIDISMQGDRLGDTVSLNNGLSIRALSTAWGIFTGVRMDTALNIGADYDSWYQYILCRGKVTSGSPLHFKVADAGVVTAGAMLPLANNTYALGAPGVNWLAAYVTIIVAGAGLAGTPSITSTVDATTGLFFATGVTGIANAGVETMRTDAGHNVVIGTAAIATTATDGFPYLPSCAGTPTGVPTGYTGRVPIVVDTTGSKIWFRIGGAWKGVVVA